MNHFVDYYEDLQVSPNADKETIDSVYRILARRWHPDNTSTGDSEKFQSISEAHNVLSDPEKRTAYDAGYESNKASQWEAFSQFPSSEKAGTDTDLRDSLLSILYVSRRQEPENAGVGMWRMAKLVGWPEKEISFHIWYLKEKKFIERDDSGGYAITAEGVDLVESRKIEAAHLKLIPFDEKPQNMGIYAPRLLDGVYEAQCIKYSREVILDSHKKLFLIFKIIETGEFNGKKIFMAFNMPYDNKVKQGSKYFKAWCMVNGWAKPSRNAKMSPKLFLNKIYKVKTRTVKPKSHEKGMPEDFWYSVVDEILEVVQI